VLLLFSAQAPGNEGRLLAESLEKRGDAILASAKQEQARLQSSNRGFLAGALDHQIVLLEALLLDLRTQLAQKDFLLHLHHIHVIEEELLHLENQISDELRIVNQVQTGFQPNPTQTHDALIKRGQDLVAKGKEELERHRFIREGRLIEQEIEAIETLIKAIQTSPTSRTMTNDEMQLERHERTLTELLERANVRNPRVPGGPGRGGL